MTDRSGSCTDTDAVGDAHRRRRPWATVVLVGLGAAAAAIGLAACQPIVPSDCTVEWIAPGAGNWSDAGNWSGGTVPVATDTVCSPSGASIVVDDDVTVAAAAIDGTLEIPSGSLSLTRRDRVTRIEDLTISGGRVGGTSLIEASSLTWTGGTIDGEAFLVAGDASMSGTTRLAGTRQLFVTGASTVTGALELCDSAAVRNMGAMTATDLAISGGSCPAPSTAPVDNAASGTIELHGAVDIGLPFLNAGQVSAAPTATASFAAFSQSAGTTSVGEGAVIEVDAALALDAGRLEGSGTVRATITGAGTIAPGGDTATLTIDGDYLSTAGSTIELGIAGPSASSANDRLVVTGSADVQDAALSVSLTTVDAPPNGQIFDIVSAAAVVGPPATTTLPGTNAYLVASPTTLFVHIAPCDPNTFYPGADLSFADLSGVDLRQCDLSGADLSDADLGGAILDGADLTDANLSYAYLDDASAIGTIFVNTNFTGVSLYNADFTDADLTGAYLTNSAQSPLGQAQATWSNTTCPNGLNSAGLPNGCEDTFTGQDCPTRTFAPFADLTNCNLTNADLSLVDLSDADLGGAILDGADLTDANLSYAYLDDASAIGTIFVNTNFTGVSLYNADFTDADLTGAYLTNSAQSPLGQAQATWSNTTCPNGLNSAGLPNGCEDTFTGQDCPTRTFAPFADLTNCNLTNADLSLVDLSDADLGGAILDGADLTDANLSYAYLDDASAIGTIFVNTNFTGVSLYNADFTDADLTGAYLTNSAQSPLGQAQATWSNTTCPNGLNSAGLPNGCEDTFTGQDCPTRTFAPFADLTNCNLTNADLSLVDLSDADLGGAILDGADLTDANLSYAYLDDASAIGTIFVNTNFTGVSLYNADFTDADLTGAYLTNSAQSPLGQAQATWSNTTCPNGLNSAGLPNGCEDTFTGQDCPTRTFAPFADLTNCNLTNADLSLVDLSDADLGGAILDGADLTDANLSYAYLDDASAIGTIFVNTNFTGVSLYNADFTDADLTGAYLTNSAQSPLGQAQATWSNTTCPNGLNSAGLPNGCEDTFLVGPGAPIALGVRRTGLE